MGFQSKKISVITPSFNSVQFIGRAIESVFSQDYENWEHLVIDGGSTDGTVKVLKRYKHLLWTSEPDAGQADAMNKGFAKSTGDIIVYLNADDYFFPGTFSTVIKEFDAGADFVVGNVLVKSSGEGIEFLNVPQFTFKAMLHHWEPNAFCHNPVGYFYLRKVQETCPFNVDNHETMDLEFLLEAASRFDFQKVNVTLGCFENGKDTKTGIAQKRLDYWSTKTFPYIERYLDQLSEAERLSFEWNRQKGYLMLQAHANALSGKKHSLIDPTRIPRISIIIPTYNCGTYLGRAIDSVLAQHLFDFEIIIIDDASTDDTSTILCEKYANIPEIRIIKHSNNKRQGAARNTGIEAAKGEYIFFLDADDWLDQDALIHLGSIAITYDADIVACGAKKTWASGKKETYHSYAFSCEGGKEALGYFVHYYIGSIVWDKLYRKDFLDRNNLRFCEPFWFEDVLFTLNALYKCNRYISISDTYYNYFHRDESTANGKSSLLHLRSFIKVIVDLSEFVKSNRIADLKDGAALAQKLITSHGIADMFPRIIRYNQSLTPYQWESQCRAVCMEFFGNDGPIFASIILSGTAGERQMFWKDSDFISGTAGNQQIFWKDANLRWYEWKLISLIRNSVDLFLPLHSKRRECVKRILKLVKHLIRFHKKGAAKSRKAWE
jgi:glycosyltransferase involved in cell wall biosynthesis